MILLMAVKSEAYPCLKKKEELLAKRIQLLRESPLIPQITACINATIAARRNQGGKNTTLHPNVRFASASVQSIYDTVMEWEWAESIPMEGGRRQVV